MCVFSEITFCAFSDDFKFNIDIIIGLNIGIRDLAFSTEQAKKIT